MKYNTFKMYEHTISYRYANKSKIKNRKETPWFNLFFRLVMGRLETFRKPESQFPNNFHYRIIHSNT